MKVGIVAPIACVLAVPALFGEKPNWSPPSQGASLEIADAVWDFGGTANGIELSIRGPNGEKKGTLKALEGRQIVRLVATSSQARASGTKGSFRGFIGLGIESLSEDGMLLEYRMAFCRNWRVVLQGESPSAGFDCSALLITRAVDRPFDVIGVGLPGGDSLILTLQDLTRKGDSPPDQIETHTFVDHCPSPLVSVVQHYVATSMALQRQPKPGPEQTE